MTVASFDVVIVPDFVRKWAAVFEARTLFFLAAWSEHAGPSRSFPLHIASVGEPPDSVRQAAERYGAEISVHEPVVGIGSFMSNKLRGFEVAARTEHILLVDVDVLVLGDLSELCRLDGSVAALPIGKPPLRMVEWRAAYQAAGMEVPAERISSMYGDLLDPDSEHLRTAKQNAKLRQMVPMYQGGVVFSPTDVGLREAWEQSFRAVSENFVLEDAQSKWIINNDEVQLAIAIEQLKRRGVPFARLPDMFHAQWPHMWGRYGWGEPRLFHLMGFLRNPDLVLGRDELATEIRDYCDSNRRRHLDGDNRFKEVVRQDPESFLQFTHELEAELLRLLDDHVAPALERTAKASRVL